MKLTPEQREALENSIQTMNNQWESLYGMEVRAVKAHDWEAAENYNRLKIKLKISIKIIKGMLK